MYYRNIQFNNLFKKYKNPDSSPVTESWERNARDCTAKLRKIWNTTNFSLKDLNTTSEISCKFTIDILITHYSQACNDTLKGMEFSVIKSGFLWHYFV